MSILKAKKGFKCWTLKLIKYINPICSCPHTKLKNYENSCKKRVHQFIFKDLRNYIRLIVQLSSTKYSYLHSIFNFIAYFILYFCANNKNHTRRTHLLLWELEEVQITTMADPSMFGSEKLKLILQELNPDSPWPSEDLEFSTLWCRQVRFDVNKWRVQLRDFPQPLMDSTNIHFWGKLAAGEAEAPKRSTYKAFVFFISMC